MSAPEAWLRGPVDGVAPVLQPAAHALIQAAEDVARLARGLEASRLWARPGGAASAGFHLLHLAGALDRLYAYARGEPLTDAQKTALRAESEAHPDLDGSTLARLVLDTINRALDQLRRTDPSSVYDERKVGRAGLPSNVLGLLFHGAEHATRHAAQFTTTLKFLTPADPDRATHL